MAVPTIIGSQIKSGPGRILWAPSTAVIPTLTAATGKLTGVWTDWVEAGATLEGLTYTESTSATPLYVAESPYPVRTETTEKGGTVAFAMTHLSDVNWKLANNGGTIVVSGTGATKMTTYIPPLVGQEVRVMLGFLSLDETEAFVFPQVFNGGGFETARGKLGTMAAIPVSFSVELPDPAVLAAPYKRWTADALAQAV